MSGWRHADAISIFRIKLNMLFLEIDKTYKKSYLLIRNSDGKTLYMEGAQNDGTNPDT